MNLIQTILFYSLSCSTIFMYGIGLERSFLDSGKDVAFYSRIPALLLMTLGTFLLVWFPVSHFLIPFNLSYLVPVFSVAVCVLVQYGLSLAGVTAEPVPGEERVFHFGIIFLGVFEGLSLYHGLLIIIAGILSYTLVTTLLFSIRERLRPSRIPSSWKGAPLSLISLGLLSLAFYAPDLSWWSIPR